MATTQYSTENPAQVTMDQGTLPTNYVPNLSTVNDGYSCFVKQQFSLNLQVYMVYYNYLIGTNYAVSGL